MCKEPSFVHGSQLELQVVLSDDFNKDGRIVYQVIV